MKIFLLTALLFVSFQASANSTLPPITYPQSQSDSYAQANSVSDSVSGSSVDNRINETITSVVMYIPACNDGDSASADGVGIGLSQRSPNCVYIDDINASMAAATFFRNQAKLCPDDPEQQEHLHRMAHEAIDDVDDYLKKMRDYADDRSITASIAAWFKDTFLPIAAIVGIVVLL